MCRTYWRQKKYNGMNCLNVLLHIGQKVHLSFSTMLWENLNEPFGQFMHSMQLHISEEHTRNRIQARESDGCGIGFGEDLFSTIYALVLSEVCCVHAFPPKAYFRFNSNSCILDFV